MKQNSDQTAQAEAAPQEEADKEEPSKLHGRLQLVYLALKVIEVAVALLRACL